MDLGVNIDHVATIRQARKADEPDPVWAAVQCELAGVFLCLQNSSGGVPEGLWCP